MDGAARAEVWVRRAVGVVASQEKVAAAGSVDRAGGDDSAVALDQHGDARPGVGPHELTITIERRVEVPGRHQPAVFERLNAANGGATWPQAAAGRRRESMRKNSVCPHVTARFDGIGVTTERPTGNNCREHARRPASSVPGRPRRRHCNQRPAELAQAEGGNLRRAGGGVRVGPVVTIIVPAGEGHRFAMGRTARYSSRPRNRDSRSLSSPKSNRPLTT